MIELAPYHKIGLPVSNPLMTAAGCFGYGMEYAGLVDLSRLGAFVTNPVTLSPRRGVPQPRLVDVPGGCVLQTGNHNPGVRRVIQQYANVWKRIGLPVIIHLAMDDPDALRRTARALESTGAVAGFELGLTDGVSEMETARIIAAIRESELPLLARLPLPGAVEMAQVCVEAGADGLVVAAPPRAAARHPSGRLVTGNLYGQAIHALVLPLLVEIATLVDAPLIGCGGIHSLEDAQAFLDAGAVAVELDSAVFVDPSLVTHLIEGLG